jgi:HEAT repeat protein
MKDERMRLGTSFLLIISVLVWCVHPAPGRAAGVEKGYKKYYPDNSPAEVTALIEKAMSRDPQMRADAAEELGDMGPRAAPAVAALIELLSDHDGQRMVHVEKPRGVGYKTAFVCDVASHALAKIGDPAVEPCLAALKEQSSVEGRCDVIHVLGHLNDPRATRVLAELVKDPQQEIRRSTMSAL